MLAAAARAASAVDDDDDGAAAGATLCAECEPEPVGMDDSDVM